MSKRTTIIVTAAYFVAAAIVALGYSIFYTEIHLPNGCNGQLLDVIDYISTSCMLPLASMLTAILVGWVIKPTWIIDELEASGHPFAYKKLYVAAIRYAVPSIMAILFFQSTGLLEKILK